MDRKIDTSRSTIIIGWYTFILHLLMGFYFLDTYRGGESDWVPSPLFEYSGETMYQIALALAGYSFVFMFVASLGLIRGVKTETRIFYFPWLYLSAFEVVFLFYQFCYLLWKYSYDPDTILIAVMILIYASYHFYLYLVVLSNYRYLKRLQSPTLIFTPEI